MKDQWFFEAELPGMKLNTKIGIRVKKKIFSGESPYQKIDVLDTYEFGRMLVLDNMVQLTKRDEFIYHEMIVHPALFSHSGPKKILIVGGGDGGALREVLRHPVKEVYLVDIDKKVIEISQKYLSFVSKGAFRDKRVKVLIEDGIKFVKNYKNFFEVIIIDLTDPLGPSLELFSKNFYRIVYNALTKDGIMVIQSGSLFFQLFQVKRIFKDLGRIFPYVKIHRTCIPCFFDAEYSFTLASKFNLKRATLKDIEKKYEKLKLDLKYYSPEIHFSSTVLPKYLEEKIYVNT